MSIPVNVIDSVLDIDGTAVPVGTDGCAVTIGIYRFGATELRHLSALVKQARDKATENAFALAENGGAAL